MLLVVQSVSEHLVALGLSDKLLRLLQMLFVHLNGPFNRLGKLLDVFNFLLVLVVYHLQDLEGPVRLAVDLEYALFVRTMGALLLHLHAVVLSLGALHVEPDLALLLVALYAGAHVKTFLAADEAALVESVEVKSSHVHRGTRRHHWLFHPEGAAVVHPVVERVSGRSLYLQKSRVSLDEVTVVLGGVVVGALVLVEVKEGRLLSLQVEHDSCQCWRTVASVNPGKFDASLLLVKLSLDIGLVHLFTTEQRCQAGGRLPALVECLLRDFVQHFRVLLREHLWLKDPVPLSPGQLSSACVSVVVILQVGGEHICRLHGTASLGAEQTLDHETPLESEGHAVVAKPLRLGDLVDAKARLVHRHAACRAEHDLIVVLVVPNAADGAQRILLRDLGPLLVVGLQA